MSEHCGCGCGGHSEQEAAFIDIKASLFDNVERLTEEWKKAGKEVTDADVIQIMMAYIDAKNGFLD